MVPISYNVRSLLQRKTTTFAAVFGIALVVFVLAAAMMLSSGIRKTVASSGSPDNALVLRTGADAELSSNIDQNKVGLVLSAPGVKKDQTGQPIGAGEVLVVITAEKAGDPEKIANVQVRGVTDRVMKLRDEVRILKGRPAQPGTDEVIIGKRVQGKYAGIDFGRSFELKKNRPVNVVGVFEAGGTSFESEIWADIDTVRTSFGREGLVSSITVALDSSTKYDAFAAAIEHDKQVGLDAYRESEYYEKQSQGTATFISILGIVIAIFLSFGAMIGAAITMYGAVSQRTREIGTLRALGFGKGAILFSMLLEALGLALIGGVLGLLASLALGAIEISMMNFATWSEVTFTFDPAPGILAFALIFGAVMGLVGGLFPAVKAAGISPIAAMRD